MTDNTEDDKEVVAILKKIDTDITSDNYFNFSDATKTLTELIASRVVAARIDELNMLMSEIQHRGVMIDRNVKKRIEQLSSTTREAK